MKSFRQVSVAISPCVLAPLCAACPAAPVPVPLCPRAEQDLPRSAAAICLLFLLGENGAALVYSAHTRKA